MANQDISVADSQNQDINVTVSQSVISGSFTNLTDTPSDYSGVANSYVRVNSDEDGLEFVSESSAVDWGEIDGTLSNQTDLQDALDLKYDSADFNSDFDTRLGNKDITDLDTYSHTSLTDIGTNTHSDIDTHIADNSIHFEEGDISITESQISDLDKYTQTEVDNLLDNKEDNLTFSTGLDNSNQTITTVDSEIDHDSLKNFEQDEHFTESSIDHLNIQNIGTNTHEEIDTELNNISTDNFKNSKVYLNEDNDTYIWFNSSNGKIELIKNGSVVQRW